MVDVNSFIKESCNELQVREETYKEICGKIIDYLESVLKGSDIEIAFVSGRNKSVESLREKIYRKNYACKYSTAKDLLDNLSDGIGVRVVCLQTEDEEKIVKYLMQIFDVTQEIDGRIYYGQHGSFLYIDYTKQPELQKNGLSIYRMDSFWKDDNNKVKVEIQIKSLVHLLWGEVEHSLFYKNYDYIMSNDYFSNLMKSLNIELENIDLQIASLKKHLEQNDTNTSEEVRQIAGFILAKHFREEITKCIGCEIDLREAYDAIVDLYFAYELDTNRCFDILRDLDTDIKKAGSIEIIYRSFISSKLDDSMIAPRYGQITTIINKKIQDGDVFWNSFTAIYCALKSTENSWNYSDVLLDVSRRFFKMVEPCWEGVDAFEENISSLVINFIQEAIFSVFEMEGKIGFFSIERRLRKLVELTQLSVIGVQNALIRLNGGLVDEEVLVKNKRIITEFIRLEYLKNTNEKIYEKDISEVLELIDSSELELPFDDIFEYAKKQSDFSSALIDEICHYLQKRGDK